MKPQKAVIFCLEKIRLTLIENEYVDPTLLYLVELYFERYCFVID